MRRREVQRINDPAGIGLSIREERLGGLSERLLRDLIERVNRFDRLNPNIAYGTQGPWFRENVGSTGAGNYSMRLMTLDTTTSLAATGAGVDIKQGSPGRVTGATIVCSTNVTAGSTTVGVLVDNGTGQPLTDIVLNTTNPRTFTYRVGWKRGIPFAAGQTIEPVLITAGSFLPITADIAVLLHVGWEEPS